MLISKTENTGAYFSVGYLEGCSQPDWNALANESKAAQLQAKPFFTYRSNVVSLDYHRLI